MSNPPKTATLLVDLLAEQHKTRSPHLFRKGTFTLAWRAKVGSCLFPNLETIVSAAEPCGRFDWRSQSNADEFDYDQAPPEREDREHAPEYFGSLSELADSSRKRDYKFPPLNGYIPGSTIRGITRAWAIQQSAEVRQEALRLLGKQDNNSDEITPGKIEFLDAWPEKETRLAIDVVNPQEKFQVYHDNSEQPAPHALYTLGNGMSPVVFNVAIRGIPGKTNDQEMNAVWQWVQQALAEYGLGGRTASGYGILESASTATSAPNPNHQIQRFDFTLYTQGVEGAIQGKKQMELRPSHWRGWLRSWTLRFLLGVMSETNAKIILEELFGTIESTLDGKHRKGCVRVQLLPKQTGKSWGELSKQSKESPDFYIWQGQIQISAPADLLEPILLPIVKFAASLGNVGRGWRRPLHFFIRKNKKGKPIKYARGGHLILKQAGNLIPYRISTECDKWKLLYAEWSKSVKVKWGDRGTPDYINAEVFSPETCSIYAVPGPNEDPINLEGNRSNRNAPKTSSSAAMARGARPGQKSSSSVSGDGTTRSKTVQWSTTSSTQTRGEAMNLVYMTQDSNPPRNYKGNPNVGGKAAGGGSKSSFCSWVSIRRINEAHQAAETDCQEMVCLFLGKRDTRGFNADRWQFLQDLERIDGSKYLFGVRGTPQSQ